MRPGGGLPQAPPPPAAEITPREQVGRLLAAAEGTPVAVPLLCLLTLGVRRGELLGLQWGDIDFEKGQVSVRRTLEESSLRPASS